MSILQDQTNTTEFTEELISRKRRVGDKWWLAPKGNPNAQLMLILSHPGKDDMEAGELFTGSYRTEVVNALAAAGIETSNVWVTSMVKTGIGAKPKSTAEQITEGAAQLDWEIAYVKPKLIMTLGAEVFKRLMKKNMSQGDFLGEIIDCPYGKLIPNFSPGMILNQDPKKRPQFRSAFVLARRFLEDRLDYTPFTWEVVDDVERSKQIVKHYIDNNLLDIGYDGEWKGSKFTDDEVLYTFQFCCVKDHAIILDISKDGRSENQELLNTVKPLLEHPNARRMGWNVRADDKRLRKRGFNMPENTLAFDGMKACAFFDSRLEKGLQTGITNYTNYEPYYNELTRVLKETGTKKNDMSDVKLINPNVFWKYCAGDAVAHREACLNMMAAMDKLDPHIKAYYYNTYLPLSNYFLDLEMHGIPIDQEVMADITEKYRKKYDELLTKLRGLVQGYMPEFNPASAPQKKALLYDHLKLNPAYYTKSGKSPKPRAWYVKQKTQTQSQYSPSTNNKSLATMKFELQEEVKNNPDDPELQHKLEVVSTLLSLNRVGVFANKFLNPIGTEFNEPTDYTAEYDEEDEPLKSSYWAALCNDGRIHADFFECLANFRSSSKVNVQNPASKVLSHIPSIFVPNYESLSKEQRKEVDKQIPRNIRHIFYSGHPDWLWAEVDVAGADLAIAAFLSQDPDYITDILRGSFHLTKAREYFRDPNVSKDDYSKYVSAKAITFRVAYTAELHAAAEPIQAEIFAESGIMVPIEDISYALETWKRYDQYMKYRERCKKMVDEKGYIENARGIKYFFEDSEDFKILAGWKNESLAYPIASELALFLWDVSVSIKKYLQQEGIWNKWCFPVNSVHDASYWIIHKDLMKDGFFPEMAKHFFTNECKIATGNNLGMEMVVASRWKGKDTVFSNETQWDFENGLWKWKH